MTDNLNLARRILDVLTGFRYVSNAPAGRFPDSIETKVSRRPGKAHKTLKHARRAHGESRPPSGTGRTDYDHWRSQLAKAVLTGGNALYMAVLEAEIALEVAKKAPKGLKADDERSQVIIDTCEGLDPFVVAARFKCSPAHVRALRARWQPDSRDPETGSPKDVDPRRALALALRTEGLSVRRIAAQLGAPKSSVHEWLNACRNGCVKKG